MCNILGEGEIMISYIELNYVSQMRRIVVQKSSRFAKQSIKQCKLYAFAYSIGKHINFTFN